jgi:SulP family sulfate permease
LFGFLQEIHAGVPALQKDILFEPAFVFDHIQPHIRGSMLKKIFPFLKWPISKATVRADFIAGLTVALVLIPQSMAYANLAGLPPYVGLYAAFLPAIVGALWGSSNYLQTGPVAMVSLLTATALATFGAISPEEYFRLAGLLAFIVGTIWLVMAIGRLTFVVNFLSRPVIEGFIHAGAIIIATSQLSKISGINMPNNGHFFHNLWKYEVLELNHAHIPTLIIGCVSLALLLGLKKLWPKIPAALTVMILSSLAVYSLKLNELARPVSVVGLIPSGCPRFTLITPDWETVRKLLPGAAVIAFVGFMEMCSVANALAAKNKQKLNICQETVGQGLASLVSAFTGGYPVSGSFSRSALSDAAGAKTGLCAVFSGLFVLLFLMFFTKLIFFLPQAALAAVIIAAVLNLLHFKRFAHYFKVSRTDGLAGVATFVATLSMAPDMDKGIIFGAGLSIVMYLYRTMKPNVAVLGRHEDGTYRNAQKYGLAVDPVMPSVRFDGRLYFASTAYFEEQIFRLCEKYPAAKFIAVDCQGINAIDASGEEMLGNIVLRLRSSGVQLLFSGVKDPVRKVLDRSGLTKEIGEQNFFHKLDAARTSIP